MQSSKFPIPQLGREGRGRCFPCLNYHRTGISWKSSFQHKPTLNYCTFRTRLLYIMLKSQYKYQKKNQKQKKTQRKPPKQPKNQKTINQKKKKKPAQTYRLLKLKFKIKYFSLFPSTFAFSFKCFISIFEGPQQKERLNMSLKWAFIMFYFLLGMELLLSLVPYELLTVHSQHPNLLLMMTQWIRPFIDTV